jgi:hypothetical protein
VLDLAKMAQQAYNVANLPAPIDGYNSIQSILGCPAPLPPNGCGGFFAQVFQNGNQIVVSFRGTSPDNIYNSIKTLLADSSFLSGISSFTADGVDPDLLDQLEAGAHLLASIANNPAYAGDSITLTGHSLGGAIAQILGARTGLPTQAFDAPGAGDLINLPAVEDALEALNTIRFANSGNNVNLRMYGDQISLVGAGIGPQETIATTSQINTYLNNPPIVIAPEAPIPLTPIDIAVARTFLDNHDISLMVSQLERSAPITTGDAGPRATIPIALAELSGQIARYIALQVFGQVDEQLDPPSGQFFLFIADAGSPSLYAVTLPALFGVNEWDIEEFLGGQWTPDSLLDPLETFYFDSGAMEFQFWALDQNNYIFTLPSGFVFDLQFATDGVFTGTIEADAAVPEPRSSFMLITMVTLFLGLVYRRRVTTWSHHGINI